MFVEVEAMIAGEHNDSGIVQLKQFQGIEKLADIRVGHGDHGMVGGDRLLLLPLRVACVVSVNLGFRFRDVFRIIRGRFRKLDFVDRMLLEEGGRSHPGLVRRCQQLESSRGELEEDGIDHQGVLDLLKINTTPPPRPATY